MVFLSNPLIFFSVKLILHKLLEFISNLFTRWSMNFLSAKIVRFYNILIVTAAFTVSLLGTTVFW